MESSEEDSDSEIEILEVFTEFANHVGSLSDQDEASDKTEELNDSVEEFSDDDNSGSLLSISPPSSQASPSKSCGGIPSPSKFSSSFRETERITKKDKQPATTNKPIASTISKCDTLFLDPVTQGMDDFFKDVGYASLADYLAEVERNDKKPELSSNSQASVVTDTEKQKIVPIPECSTTNTKNSKQPKSKSKNVPTKETLELEPVRRKPRKTAKSPQMKEKANSAISSSTSVQTAPAAKLKPGESFKMIILQVAEEVMTDDLAAKLLEKEVKFKIIENPSLPSSILFERNVPYNMIGPDQQIQRHAVVEMDDNIMIVFNVEKGLKLLQEDFQSVSGPEDEDESLTKWIGKIKKSNPGKKITLLIQGLETYMKKVQRYEQKEYRDRVLKGDNAEKAKRKRKVDSAITNKMSRKEIQSTLIGVQLTTGINYRFYENTSDLATFLLQYAKAVGEAPYKREQMTSTDFDWYAFSDSTGGIPVEEDGKGMRSLWISQLCLFPNVGQDSALAISKKYGSPRALYEAYQRCSSLQEGNDMLAEIQVTMGVGPLAKTRRLGPEASKKIYRFFTTTNGDRYLS